MESRKAEKLTKELYSLIEKESTKPEWTDSDDRRIYRIFSILNTILEDVKETFVKTKGNRYDATHEFYENVEKLSGATFEITEEKTSVFLPYFYLPHKDSAHYVLMKNLLVPLFEAHRDEFIRYETRSELHITRIYTQDTKQITDYDNTIYKPLIDIVSSYMLYGDDPYCIKLVLDVEISNTPGVRVVVTPGLSPVIDSQLNQIS